MSAALLELFRTREVVRDDIDVRKQAYMLDAITLGFLVIDQYMKVNKILTVVGEAALMTPVRFTGGLASSMPPLPPCPHSRIHLLTLIYPTTSNILTRRLRI